MSVTAVDLRREQEAHARTRETLDRARATIADLRSELASKPEQAAPDRARATIARLQSELASKPEQAALDVRQLETALKRARAENRRLVAIVEGFDE